MSAQARSPREMVHDAAVRAARGLIPPVILNYRKDDIPYVGEGDIDKLAGRVLENFRSVWLQDRKNVIDLDTVVGEINGRVERDPLFGVGENIDISVEDSTFVIKVSCFAAEERNRFVVAHELGHYLLHYVAPILAHEEPFAYRFFSRRAAEGFERQADHFAASLTMPREEFVRKAGKLSGGSNFYAGLADYFKIPEGEAWARCEKLGLAAVRQAGSAEGG